MSCLHTEETSSDSRGDSLYLFHVIHVENKIFLTFRYLQTIKRKKVFVRSIQLRNAHQKKKKVIKERKSLKIG